MIVAVIGTGHVGSTLGTRWAQKGHQVVFGSRHPNSDPVRALLQSAGENACSASVVEAAAMGEIIVLAVPWSAAHDVVHAAGNLQGKVVIDCTNPIASGFKGLSVEPGTSAAEQIARWASGARVVKAFNSTGAGNMAHPDFDGQAATMFLSGDDEEAKKAVSQLAADLGFEVCDAGPLSRVPGSAVGAPGLLQGTGTRFRLQDPDALAAYRRKGSEAGLLPPKNPAPPASC